jgi:hypothetical protein
MNDDAEMAPDCLRQGFPPAHILSGMPALGEIEYILGAFVIAPRASRTRQQSGNPLLLEGLIGDIECLPTDTESFCHMADRSPIDAVAAKHLVLDLHAVPGSKNSCSPAKASSRTLCGRGWRARAARRAAVLESSGRRGAMDVNCIKYTHWLVRQGVSREQFHQFGLYWMSVKLRNHSFCIHPKHKRTNCG